GQYTFTSYPTSGTLYQYLAAAAKTKVSPDLWQIPVTGSANVIVRWQTAPTSTQEKKLKTGGAKVRNRLNVIKATAFSNVPAYLIAYGASMPEVLYISSDRPVKMSGTVVPLISAANLFPAASVDADLAWNGGWDGSGVGIALIDSGIKSHPDLNNKLLKSRVVYSQDFTSNEDTQADDVTDYYGHGTHVAGILAGNAASVSYNPVVRGVAPGANIVDLRVLDANGSGTDSAVIAAIQRAIALKSQYNIRVINLSLGRGVYESYKLD